MLKTFLHRGNEIYTYISMLLDGFGYAVLDFAPEGAPSKSHTAGGVFSRAS